MDVANNLLQNIGGRWKSSITLHASSGGLLWLNLLVGNKQKHENTTVQMGAIASQLEETRSSVLTKLEVTWNCSCYSCCYTYYQEQSDSLRNISLALTASSNNVLGAIGNSYYLWF